MADQMPSRICKNDKVRLKDRSTASKYGMSDEHVFTVENVDKVAGSPRLYVPHPKWPQELTMLWARDCVLAWPKNSKERKEALGVAA